MSERSPAVIRAGTTTAVDVAWWLRQRFHDLGVEPWFQPSVTLQRAKVPLSAVALAKPVPPPPPARQVPPR